MIVTLGKKKHTLKVPDSYTARREIWVCAAVSTTAAYGAALGICGLADKMRLRYNHNAADFGAVVVDKLIKDGIPWDDIQTAGAAAYAEIAKTIIPLEEVAEEEDFSEAPAGERTS